MPGFSIFGDFVFANRIFANRVSALNTAFVRPRVSNFPLPRGTWVSALETYALTPSILVFAFSMAESFSFLGDEGFPVTTTGFSKFCQKLSKPLR
jgi:hypothetical protein